MEDEDLQAFFKKVEEEATPDMNLSYDESTEITGAQDEYALVREVGEDDNDVFIQILATGNMEGIQFMHEKALEYFKDFKGGAIATVHLYDHSEKVDLH